MVIACFLSLIYQALQGQLSPFAFYSPITDTSILKRLSQPFSLIFISKDKNEISNVVQKFQVCTLFFGVLLVIGQARGVGEHRGYWRKYHFASSENDIVWKTFKIENHKTLVIGFRFQRKNCNMNIIEKFQEFMIHFKGQSGCDLININLGEKRMYFMEDFSSNFLFFWCYELRLERMSNTFTQFLHVPCGKVFCQPWNQRDLCSAIKFCLVLWLSEMDERDV